MNRPCRRALLAPLLAVVAMLLGLSGTASAAFNPAATEAPLGNFLLWEYEASLSIPLELADPSKEIGVWAYDDTLGVPVYVRQNPWTMFDPLGLERTILVGGVATVPGFDDHDHSNDHFLAAAVRHVKLAKREMKASGKSENINMIIYSPAYDARAKEDDQTKNLQSYVDAAKKAGATVTLVKSAKDMLAEAKAASEKENTSSLKYFGHSSRDALLLNWGEAGNENAQNGQNISTKGLTGSLALDKITSDFSCGLYGCDLGNTVKDSVTAYGKTNQAKSMAETLSTHFKGSEIMGSSLKSHYKSVGQGWVSPTSNGGYKYWKNGKVDRTDSAGELPKNEQIKRSDL